MKQYIKYVLIALLPFLLFGCENNFLDLSDPDTFDMADYYQTEEDMEQALFAVYGMTQHVYETMFFVTEMKSDNTTTNNTGDSGGLYYTFVNHGVASNNSIVITLYGDLYRCIYRANLVLQYINNVPMSEEKRERMICEAKFLRALSHFYLVRLFGPITVMDKIMVTKSETLRATRQPISDAYNLIVSDLKAVANSIVLPAKYTLGNGYGRVSSTAGAALLGKVYLTMAATQNQPTYYTDAILYLEKACTLANYTQLQLPYNTLFDLENEMNEEFIFQCCYVANEEESSPFAYNFQPYLHLIGLSEAKGRGYNMGQYNLYKEFEDTTDGFARFDNRVHRAIVYDSVSLSGYYTKKYIDMTNQKGYGGNDWVELRFADVFLMLAEAYERVEGNNSAKAIDYLDKVRMRTGNQLDNYATSKLNVAYATAYPTLRDAIFHERRMELCFENHRWFDLIRLYPNQDDFVRFMHSVAEPGGMDKYTGFQAYEMLLPIPYEEVSLNHNIYQNPGY